MKIIKTAVGLLIVFILTAGCMHKVSFTPTGKTFPPFQGVVKIFESPPTNIEFVEIGWVSSQGDWNNAWTDLLGDLQKMAASNGANAIIISATNYPETWGVGWRRAGERSIIAKAIRILEPEDKR